MSEDIRPDPDALLAAIHREAAKQTRGKLKVFLGMSAGVGKTYAMLEAAQKAKHEGRDVVIGYVESHGRKETDVLTAGLPTVPRRVVGHGGVTLSEMDLDAVLARRPQLAVVDEFAHSNAPGSRHPKRWQDVEELLAAGIDVSTTLNVQHIESRTDTIRQITGSTIYETVPDRVLDGAEIELVDLPPEELMERLASGKVYQGERAETALFNFFREGNLTALREIALRYAAGRVGRDVQDYLQTMQIEGPWKSGPRLVVAVGASPLSAQLIRWTRRLADSLNAAWLAVHVESARDSGGPVPPQLTKNLGLARQLGGEVVTTSDEDLVRGLLRVARQHNATQIVVGKPGGGRLARLRGTLRLHRLVGGSGDVDVHVVRADADETGVATAPPAPPERDVDRSLAEQYGTAIGVIAAVSFANAFLAPLLGYRAVALTYLFGVVGLAMVLGRGPILLAAGLSALLWNFFFLPPRFTFYITNVEDGLMFGLYFVVAAVLGQLVSRVRAQELANRRGEERATALYLLTRDLADAASPDDLARAVVKQVGDIFRARVALWLEPGPTSSSGPTGRPPHTAGTLVLTEKERSVAAWAREHRQAAGRFTDNLPSSEALHLPLLTHERSLGVLSVRLPEDIPPSLDQRELLEAFARQAALVLDRLRLAATAEQTRLLAESERLGRTLLDSVSHELRTPLAALACAAESLAAAPESARAGLVGEIRLGTARLDRIIGNLLDMARSESGRLSPALDWQRPGEVLGLVRQRLAAELAGREVTVEIGPGLPWVRIDLAMTGQALANLLLNAATHTPAGTPITLSAASAGSEVVLSVADRGPGFRDDVLPQLFGKFYRVPGTAAGGTGLGLSLVKRFAEAQGGRASVANRPGGGAVFSLFFPAADAPPVPEDP